ncbi:hypothetical protein BCR42DRAFT_394811 [Absidia repens]|uniref:Uncharacterized protein n=1 Tax=Absidia repens TaxID=90262 RepID=A0A1X2I9S1_9FUNG|nr:hypothetical protein BCR42DRAFT_394811 [Absidia repens]
MSNDNRLIPSAVPKRWYSHAQTPQEEFNDIARMEEQWHRDRKHALRTAIMTATHSHRPMPSLNTTADDMGASTPFHDQHAMEASSPTSSHIPSAAAVVVAEQYIEDPGDDIDNDDDGDNDDDDDDVVNVAAVVAAVAYPFPSSIFEPPPPPRQQQHHPRRSSRHRSLTRNIMPIL